jgi:hypothetical protein
MTPEKIRNNLDKLAKDIADKAVQKDTPFTETLDAFKALHAYYALLLKNKGGPADETGVSGFDFASGIAQEDVDGGARLSRRGNS